MLSGTAVVIFSDIYQSVPAGVDAWGVSLQYIGYAIVSVGLLSMWIYNWMQKNVLTDPFYYDGASPKAEKKKKSKMGVMESFKYLFSSPYIGLIALLVLSYGMSINLIEVIWKKQLALQFKGDPNGYNTFMGNFSRATGAATITIIFLTKGVVRRFGWFTGAVITPLILAITGGLFFALVLFTEQLNPIVMGLGFTATYMAVLVGATQNILTKGTKYALFDPTKEMAYIPLDDDLKTKGKAAVDVIGGRLGKAAGGWTVLGIFTIFAVQDIMTVTPYLAVIIMGIVLAWIVGVGALSVRYNRANGEMEAEIEAGKKAAAGKPVTA
jgi:AAA family ATP:ADP antiporter